MQMIMVQGRDEVFIRWIRDVHWETNKWYLCSSQTWGLRITSLRWRTICCTFRLLLNLCRQVFHRVRLRKGRRRKGSNDHFSISCSVILTLRAAVCPYLLPCLGVTWSEIAADTWQIVDLGWQSELKPGWQQCSILINTQCAGPGTSSAGGSFSVADHLALVLWWRREMSFWWRAKLKSDVQVPEDLRIRVCQQRHSSKYSQIVTTNEIIYFIISWRGFVGGTQEGLFLSLWVIVLYWMSYVNIKWIKCWLKAKI